MKITIPYMQYQTDVASDTWSEWAPTTLMLDAQDKLQSIEIETNEGMRSIDAASVAVFRCIDPQEHNLPKNVFWYVLDSSRFLYRAEYNPHPFIKGCVKAVPVRSNASPTAVGIPGLEKLTEVAYKAMVADADSLYQESQRAPASLLSMTEIAEYLVRPADAIITERLTDAVDVTLEKTKQFQKQYHEAYLRKGKEELSALVTENLNYSTLKKALKAFLTKHAERQNLSVAYTAFPHHPVTQLLIVIAKRIGETEGKPAISYLFPRVYTESSLDESPNLDALPLEHLFSTHILDSSQQYLLPIDLLLAKTTPLDEEPSPLITPQGIMNPYYNLNDKDNTHVFVTPTDLERLFQHSSFTYSLRDNYLRYQKALFEESTLLGQLNTLIFILGSSDAYKGVGRKRDVAGMAYPAIMAFMAYYRELNPIGMYLLDKKPTLDVLPEERHIGYVFVSEGEDAGLYCVNRYDKSIKQCCGRDAKQRYSVDLIRMQTFEDTEVLRAQLSQEHPTLIQVGDDIKSYWVYGRKEGAGVFGFTFIDDLNTKTRFPAELNRRVTLALGNVPEDVYEAVDRHNAHLETARVIDFLKQKYATPTTASKLEELYLIQAHTGHLDLSEFHNVPETVRCEVNALWGFIQDPAKNTSATRNIATCVANIRANLELAVRSNASTLETICLDEQAIDSQYQVSLQALKESREALEWALQSHVYESADPIPPSPDMLKYLGITLTIQTPADLQWFYTFPPKSLEAFLSDEDNPQPKTYLQQKCDSLEDILMMLIDAPTQAFGPLVTAIAPQIKHHISIPYSIPPVAGLILVLRPLSADKRAAFLEALGGLSQLSRFIRSIEDFSKILEELSEEQCTVVCATLKASFSQLIKSGINFADFLEPLSTGRRVAVYEAFKDQFPKIIKSGRDFGYVLKPLSPEQRTPVYETFKDQFPEIIKSEIDFLEVLRELLSEQRTAVYESFKEQLPKIIKSGWGFFYVVWLLSPEQRTAVYENFKKQLPKIIKSGEDFSRVLELLSTEQRTAVYEIFKEQLPIFITSAKNFREVLQYLSPEQCSAVCAPLKDRLYQIFESEKDFRRVLTNLSPEQSIAVNQVVTIKSELQSAGLFSSSRINNTAGSMPGLLG